MHLFSFRKLFCDFIYICEKSNVQLASVGLAQAHPNKKVLFSLPTMVWRLVVYMWPFPRVGSTLAHVPFLTVHHCCVMYCCCSYATNTMNVTATVNADNCGALHAPTNITIYRIHGLISTYAYLQGNMRLIPNYALTIEFQF